MTAEKAKTLKAALVGCGSMGGNQARILASLREYELAAVCDVNEENARRVSAATGAKAYTEYDEMLSAERPETVSVCTANDTHARLTIRAAEAGARGVYCEKPMATCMADARAMVEACRKAGAALVVNHQRRLGADLVEMRGMMEPGAVGTTAASARPGAVGTTAASARPGAVGTTAASAGPGAVGEVRVIRGHCAGDVLSDGTHLVDSLMWLAGDRNVEWVLGQVHRDLEAASALAEKAGPERRDPVGFRYGHPVETGAFGVFSFEDGPRAEISCGDMREKHRAYQDYEVFADRGRLWRTGDRHDPNLFVQDAAGGTWTAGLDDWTYKAVPVEGGGRGEWRPVRPSPLFEGNAIAEGYRRLARTILQGEDHPMSGETAIRGFEVVMAVYESARLGRKVRLPLGQDRFPLELMIEEGRL